MKHIIEAYMFYCNVLLLKINPSPHKKVDIYHLYKWKRTKVLKKGGGGGADNKKT